MVRSTKLKLIAVAVALVVLGVHSWLLLIEFGRAFACGEIGPSCKLQFPLLHVLTLGTGYLIGKWALFVSGPIWATLAYIVTARLLRRKCDAATV